MTTLGKTSTGSTTTTSSSNKTVVSTATAGASGTLTAGHLRINIDSGSGVVNMVVYADSSGAPGSLLATSDNVTVSNTTMATVDFAFSGGNQISIANGTAYWVGASWVDPGTPTFTYERDATASARQESNSNLPNPFGTPSAQAGPIAAYVEFFATATVPAQPIVVGDPEGTAALLSRPRPPAAFLTRTPVFPPPTGTVSATETVSTTATASAASNIGKPILQNVTTGVYLALEIAWGADLTDLTAASWTWTDVTTDVQLSGAGINLQMGAPNETTQTQPSQLTVTLDNTSGAYSLGPQSSNYPNVIHNVPVRLRVSTNSGASWVVHYQGNAVGFTPNWDSTGKWATVTLVSSGWLRQLNQGTLGATSYYAQTIPTSSLFDGLVYYWNNENGNGFEGSDGISYCYPTTPSGIISSTDTRVLVPNIVYLPNTTATRNSTAFPIAGPLPSAWDFTTTGTLPATTNTGSLQFRWLCGITSLPSGQTQPLLYWKTSASGSVLWTLNWDSAGNLWPSNSSGWAGTKVAYGANSKAWYFQLQMTTNGSGSDLVLNVISFDGTGAGFTWTGATGSTTGYLTGVNWLGPNINSSSTPVMQGHMTVQNATQSASTVATFYRGNPGESVTTRLTRIANAANIPITIRTDTATETSANPADTMGGQYFDTITNLLRECEATGLGRLHDGLGVGLTYITRLLRESQQPLLTLDVTTGVVVMPFAPLHDDQNSVNQAAVTRRNGSTYTYTDSTSVGDIGVYPTSLTVNQQNDSALAATARWLVNIGTPSGYYRYPSWTFALEKQPARIADWLTCFPGCRMDVTNIANVRSQHPAGTIRNVLEGWNETISQHQWHVTANTSSYEPWRVITLAAATGSTSDTVGRYEPDSDTASTVNVDGAAGATSISVAFTGTRWVTTGDTGGSDNFPLTVSINGWPVTVTNITGTTSPQTFTVSALAHAVTAGNPITIYQNAVLGM